MYVCMYVCIYMCIYIYIYIHIINTKVGSLRGLGGVRRHRPLHGAARGRLLDTLNAFNALIDTFNALNTLNALTYLNKYLECLRYLKCLSLPYNSLNYLEQYNKLSCLKVV